MEARSAARWSRRVTTWTLLLTLAITAAGCDAAALNALLASYANNANTNQLNSGDNGASIDLGDNRRLVLVNDPFLGPLNPNGTRVSPYLINNALVVWNTSSGAFQTYIGTDANGNRTARFRPPTAGRFYWLTNGVVQGSYVHLLAQERLANGWGLVNNVVLTLNKSNLSHVGTEVLSVPSSGPIWGDTIVNLGDGYSYLYGHIADPLRTVLARAPEAGINDRAQWRFWTGTAWSAYQANAAPLVDDNGNEVPYLLVPTLNSGELDMLAYAGPVYTDQIYWAASAGPTRPVTMGGVAYDTPEAGQSCGAGGAGFKIVYSVHAHTGSPAHESIWSYSTTCFGGGGSPYAADYRPRFINLNLANAPAPCPVLTTTVTQKFVRATYTDFVGALPSAPDLNQWTNHIATRGFCRSDLTDAMTRDDAYLGGLVEGLYQQLLGRSASSGDRAYWGGRMKDGTDTFARVARSIAAAPEFYSLAGGTDSGFVTRLYQRALGRTPSPSESSYWVGQLASSSRSTVALAIIQSAEGRGIRVDGLALRFLQRSFDPEGRAYWQGRLSTNGGNDIAVARALATSQEYLINAQTRF